MSILIYVPLFKSAEEQHISQTTSQYPLKHTETTQEEVAAPGRLPETPLRMDPDLLYDVRYGNEFDDRQPTQPDQNQMETSPKELISSYSVSQVLLHFNKKLPVLGVVCYVGGRGGQFWNPKKSIAQGSLETKRE